MTRRMLGKSSEMALAGGVYSSWTGTLGTATAAWCSGAKEDAGSAASFLRALAAAVLPRRGLVYNIFVLKCAVF